MPDCSTIHDRFGRRVDYLRMSVTDRCNERCLYCMPQGYRGCGTDALGVGDFVRIVETACDLGFRKFRLTGGEPLVRRDLPELVHRLWNDVPGVEALGLSTNGLLLDKLARPLRQAGLRSVNVSLDALDADLYRKLTGGDVARVRAGIEAALEAGFERIKLNAVLLRGINEDQIVPLAEYASSLGVPLRFIEWMPLSRCQSLEAGHFLPVGEAMRILRQDDALIPAPEARLGHGPAQYFRLARRGTMIGFVGALTNLRFCDSCNKMRLTSDGRLRPCLGDHGEIDLSPGLRGEQPLESLFRLALREKPEAHLFLGAYQPQRPMTAIGG